MKDLIFFQMLRQPNITLQKIVTTLLDHPKINANPWSMSTNALLLHGLPEKLLLSCRTWGLHMVPGLLVGMSGQPQSFRVKYHLTTSEDLSLSSVFLTLWTTVSAGGLVIMDWKMARFRVCHWLYALHSCQTTTIILFLFGILLPIKLFPSHLVSPPSNVSSTILIDFQLFKQRKSLQFSVNQKMWFMLLPILAGSNAAYKVLG